MSATIATSLHTLAEANCPADVREYGVRNGLPEFATATWCAGFVEGAKGARQQIAASCREPDEALVSELAWDIYDDREAIKKQVRQVLSALADHLTKGDGR